MWGAFKDLAEKAQAVAADLEGQINESVGIEPTTVALSSAKTDTVAKNSHDDDDDDVWKNDDFDLDGGLESSSPMTSTATPLPTVVSPPFSTNGHNKVTPAMGEAMTPKPTMENDELVKDHANGSNYKILPEEEPINNNDAIHQDDNGGDWASQEEEDLNFDETEKEEETIESEQPIELTSTKGDVKEPESEMTPVVEPKELEQEETMAVEEKPDDDQDGWQEDLEIDDSEQPAEENEKIPEDLKGGTNTDMEIEETAKESTVDENRNETVSVPTVAGAEAIAEEEEEEEEEPTVENKDSNMSEMEDENVETLTRSKITHLDTEGEVDASVVAEPGFQKLEPVDEPIPIETYSPTTEQEQDQVLKHDTSGNKEEVPAVNDNFPPLEDETEPALLDKDEDIVESHSIEATGSAESADRIAPEKPLTVPGDIDETAGIPAASPPAAVERPDEACPASAEQEAALQQYQQLVEQLQTELQQRETQLFSKTEQMTSMQTMFEAEKQELVQVVENTKAEAKRRIQIARERVEKAEAQVAQLSRGQSEDSQKQAQIISELRSEGEKLAMKQAEMERAVRSAKGEARKLRESLEIEEAAKEDALDKIDQLQSDLKTTKDQLASARKGESQASKLDAELQSTREDAERKASTILSLEQQVKELKTEAKELMAELEAARKGAEIVTEREQKKLRKEQSNLIDDFETKLRTAEKEAAVREDALRMEVSELRKRWQDAVRRADALSMDVQTSTAPLMRQLESMERQNRARATAWTELENKLREELEETIIANEKLVKEKAEIKTKLNRVERSSKDNESELRSSQKELEEKTYKVKELEDKLVHLEEEKEKRQKEWTEVERLANEGVARVRSEMSQTMLEADERHRSQVDSLQVELRTEREKRAQLEQQVQDLVEKAGAIVPRATAPVHSMYRAHSLPTPKLRKSEGQAEILAGALGALSDDDMDDDEDEEEEEQDNATSSGGTSSFAALEELTSRLKSTKVELNTLRKSLDESEKNRSKLVDELSEARTAREKLPLFEARVKELTAENEQMSREIEGLQADIADVRELYRNQLNALLEEKASILSSVANADTKAQGSSTHDTEDDGNHEASETSEMLMV